MVAKNNVVPNDHLRKYWYKRVKTYFDDPARKKRRQDARSKRAMRIAPRPVEGPLRPLVKCPTVRYNRRLRLGRGFTRDELIAAGFDPSRARFFGIAIDPLRNHTHDAELKKANIERLTAYKSKIVRVHKGEKLSEKSEIPAGLFSVPKADQTVQWRVIKNEEKKADLFKVKSDKRAEYKKKLQEKKDAKHPKK